MTRLTAYRSSLSPFSRLDASAVVRAPLSTVDTIYGDDSYSVQLNVLGSRYILQNVLQVMNRVSLAWTLYGADTSQKNKLVLWIPLSIPRMILGQKDDAISLTFEPRADATQMSLGFWQSGAPYPFQSLAIPIKLIDSFYACSLEVVGMGSGSLANFTAGVLDLDIEAQGIDDMAYFTYPAIPQGAPWLDNGTNEGSSLLTTFGLLAAQALKWTLSAPGTTL